MIRFNHLMQMKTFSMFDDPRHTTYHPDSNDWEACKTRLIRVDLQAGPARSPVENGLHRALRWFRFKRRPAGSRAGVDSTSFNSITLSNIVLGVLVATGTIILFVAPMVLLSPQKSEASVKEIIIISVFIGVFSFVVSFCSGSSAINTMGATAAYAAVLVVFLSNHSVTS